MTSRSPKIPGDPRDAAAYWFARRHSGSFGAAEQRAFAQWRNAHPRHDHEYRALDEIRQVAALIPDDELRQLLEAPDAPRAPGRRRLLAGAGALATLTIGATLGARYWHADPGPQQRYATARGAVRTAALADGSRLQLNTDTTVSVAVNDTRRVLTLDAGEIMLAASADGARPFIIHTPQARIVADGASINVRHDGGQTRLAVESGSAQIGAGPWWNRTGATVPAGAATSMRDGVLAPLRQVDVASSTAWRQGKLVFRDQPLADIVQEISRYLPQPIRITDTRLRPLRMGGVFDLADATAFLNALRRIMPVRTTRRADGGVDLALAA